MEISAGGIIIPLDSLPVKIRFSDSGVGKSYNFKHGETAFDGALDDNLVSVRAEGGGGMCDRKHDTVPFVTSLNCMIILYHNIRICSRMSFALILLFCVVSDYRGFVPNCSDYAHASAASQGSKSIGSGKISAQRKY